MSVAVAERVGKALAKFRRHLDRPDGLIDGQDGEQALHGAIGHGVRQLVRQALGGLADDDPRLNELLTALAGIMESRAGQFPRLEAVFVLLEQHLEPALLPAALGQLVDALLPGDLEDRAEDGNRRRDLTLRRNDDGTGWRITEGDLDLECGELPHTLLTAELATDPDNPTDTAGYEELRRQDWEDGNPLPASDRPRSLRQRRRDAFKNALRRHLDAGLLGLRDKVALHIAVTLGVDTVDPLQQTPGGLPAVAASGARLVRRCCATAR